jgi:hypothetical protein
MTQTKGHSRVNLHLERKTHELLKVWCRKQGLTLQDGLAKMIETTVRMPLSAWAAQPPDISGMFGRHMATSLAREPQPEPEPEQLPLATAEDYRHSQITPDIYEIPLDWVCLCDDGESTRTRADVIGAGGGEELLQYSPPPAPIRPAQ